MRKKIYYPSQVVLILLCCYSLETTAQNQSSATATRESRSTTSAPRQSLAFPISGKIMSSTGEALQGAVISVKGASQHATTDAGGTFSITLPTGTGTLVITHVGYASQEIPVNNRSTITVTLESDAKTLTDVVVVGYGTQKKKNVTGAIANFNAEKLDERPLTRVDQALVGQLAGVTVKQTSGTPGKAFSIQVRGTGSITAGNEPLYVIDGFPLATAAPNGSGNFGTGNPLDNINPNDIESIQVLKDASAAAIYGSRAANGVVLITTKKGKSGKPMININSYMGYSQANRKLDMLSAEEWVDRATEMINAAYVSTFAAQGAKATDDYETRRTRINETLAAGSKLQPGQVNTGYMLDDRWSLPGHPGLRYIDWQDETFRKGIVQNQQLSASGGNEFVKYYLSGNFVNQDGFVKGMDYRSYSARANLEVNASSKLKFGINLAPTYSVTNDPGVEGKDNILHQLVSFTPVQEDSMGLYPNVGKNAQYRWGVSTNSVLGKLENIIGQTKRFRTITSLYAEYQIIKGLAFKTTVNLDNTDNNSKSYVPYTVASAQATRAAQLTALTTGSYTSYRKQTFVNENTLSYNKTLGDVHDLSLLAGASYNVDKLDNVRLTSSNGFSSSVITTLNAASALTGNTTEAKNVLLSYFGRAQYSFNNKYLLSATIRKDGSSRFGANTKWGVFPSASVGWRISEEDFMKDLDLFNDLKLRGSWGRSGNYNIGDYSTIPLLAVANYNFGGNTPAQVIGQAPAGITNPDLTWEKSETFDVGLDVSIFKNRITASVDYYSKLNTALLLNVPIPGITGFASYLSNAGSAKNKGWEVEISSRNLTGDLQWNTSVNFSHNSNKVISLAGGQTQILIPSLFDIPHSILKVGEPMYSIYAVEQIGILTQEDITKKVAVFGPETVGDPKYRDANGDGIIDANDRMIVGQPNPKYTYGMTNTVRYKGFDLSVLVQGQSGGYIYSLLGRALGRTGQGVSDNALGFYRDRWRSPENPGAGRVSKAYSTFGRIINTDWLYSSDYFRVRNITAGYDLGRAFKSKRIVQAARVYVTVENFFGHDKYKGGFNPEATNTDLSGSSLYPEAGDYGGLPLPKSLILGLNFTF